MKRLVKAISMLLAIVMVVGLLPLSIIAEDIHSTHTVQFKLNYNGAHKIPSQKVAGGECAVQPEDVTREGWIFEYWYVKTGDNGVQKFDLSQPITEDVTLYARWDEDIEYWGPIWNRNILGAIEDSDDEMYTVTYDANGENVKNLPTAQKVKVGEVSTIPPSPTREGYLFAGWYGESNCITKFDFSSPVTNDITLYPCWHEDDVDWNTIGDLYSAELNKEDIRIDSEAGIAYVAGQMDIIVADNFSKEEFSTFIGEYGGQIIGCIEIADNYQVLFDKKMSYPELVQLAEKLQSQEQILVANICYLCEYTNIVTDSLWSNSTWKEANQADGDNWGIEASNIDDVWNNEYEKIRVGVLETGSIDTQHEDLNVVTVNDSAIGEDHPTHVAGIIAAQWNDRGIAGILRNCELYGNSFSSYTDEFYTNLTTAYYLKIALADLVIRNVKIINCSFVRSYYSSVYDGTTSVDEIEQDNISYTTFVNKLLQQGYDFLIVQGSGNDSNKKITKNLMGNLGLPVSSNEGWRSAEYVFINTDIVPACDHIITVGAYALGSDITDPVESQKKFAVADFSNIGDNVDVMAPGVNILSTVLTTGNANGVYPDGYKLMNGTSMATPYVVGVAGLVWGSSPQLSGGQVKDIIIQSARGSLQVDTRDIRTILDDNGRVVSDYKTKDELLKNRVFTYRMLDAATAVQMAKNINDSGNDSLGEKAYIVGFVRETKEKFFGGHDTIPSDGASIYVDGNDISLTTDDNGLFDLLLSPGEHIIRVSKSPFRYSRYYITVEAGKSYNLSFLLIGYDIDTDKLFKIGGGINNAETNSRVVGATVRFREGLGNVSGGYISDDIYSITDELGKWSVELPAGCYTAEVSCNGYINSYCNIYVYQDDDTNDIKIIYHSVYLLSGKVTTDGTTALKGVTVSIVNTKESSAQFPPVTTADDGTYSFNVPNGTYTLTFTKANYETQTAEVTVQDKAETVKTITMPLSNVDFTITHTTNGVTTDILAASPMEVYNGTASMTWTINSNVPWKIVTNRGDWFSLSVNGQSVGLNSTFDAGETELKLNISGYTDSRSDGTIAFEVGGEIYTVEIFQIASIIASLTGTIKDGDADSPTYGQVLEGVSLDVYDFAGNKVGDTVKSNENGVVTFDFPKADTYKFVFSLVGYETVTVDTVIINENTPSLGQYVMMRAEATTSVSGTTTPGTKLELLDENGNVLAETVADANGNYEFKDIPGWDGTIFRIRIKDTTVTIEAVGGATGVAVDTTVTIFTVSTPDTVQIGNEVGAVSEWEIESSHPWTVTKSGDTSWYTLNMESGNAGITDFVVTALGTTDSYRESTLTFALNNRTFDVTIYQDFCQTVSGSVVEKTENSDEIGIENVVVVVRKAGDSSWYSQVETDVNGQYTLVFEDAGEYVMTYSHPEYNMVTVEDIVITADSTTFEAVEMVAVTNTVTGIITNIDGSVMEGVTVTVSTEEYPDKSMTTGTDGKFTFTLPIGWYDITIAKNGESKVYRSYFNIEDTSIDIGNLVMPLTLEGTVNDNENPIVNATVTLIDRTTGSNIETTQSDETGTFRFKFYTAGTYYLNISAAGYSEEFITNINITKNTSSIGDFTLTAIDITASGTYENLTWTIDASGTLSISGTGEIPHISYSSAPWYNHLSSVNSIVINEGITGVDFDAFNGKYQYSTISLPSSISKLESLSDIYQAEFVVDEDNQHFMSENGVLFNADQTILLRYVKNGDYSVPSGVIGLAEYAFAHSSVRQLDLPDTLQVIGNYAFYQSYITELNIPASVINIGTNTFSYCDNLQNIHVAEKNLHYESDNGVLFLKGKQTLIKYPGGRDDETYCIPDGVTKVLEEAFTDSMEYNGGVYSYGDTTHVYGLQRITFPASVKFIGWDDYSSDYSYISHLIFLGACPDMMGGYGVPSDGVYPTPGSVIHYTVGHSGSSNHRWTSSIWQYETSGFAYPFKTICEGAIATVTGTVKDETGTALEGVRIKGYNSSGYPVSAAITDGNGSFTIQFEEAGKYRFTFSADGYELYNLNDFAIDGTTTSFGVISMKEGVSIVASGKNGSASWLLDSEGTLTLSGTGGDLFTNLWSKYRTDVVTVVIENGITRVSGIWNGHSNLQKLQIGSTLQVMLEDFSNCEKLNHIEVAENNPYFSCKDGILYSKDQSVLYKYPPAREDTAFVIPDTVSIIGEAAFQRCVNLNEIIIPIGVTEIQTSAFRGCVIQSLSLPNSVVSIGEEGFYNCYMLKTVEIPGSLTSIGADAFKECGSLEYFSVDSSNPMYCSVDGILFSRDMTVLMCYPPRKYDVSAYTVPDSVVSIPIGIENDYLTEINLGKNVADFGDGFRFCREITDINVDAANTYYASLDGVLFNKSMDTLLEYPKNKTEQSYVIPDTVTTIAGDAFYSSDSLISIYVPEGVTTIGNGAMGYCDRLSQVYFYGNVPENFGRNIFSSLYDDSSAVLYYISGKSGWTSPTWTAPDGKVYNSATWEP